MVKEAFRRNQSQDGKSATERVEGRGGQQGNTHRGLVGIRRSSLLFYVDLPLLRGGPKGDTLFRDIGRRRSPSWRAHEGTPDTSEATDASS